MFDPSDEWSNGWQLVIDGDNRGLFNPGTIVTSNEGPAERQEVVESGPHTLIVDVHWERLPQGDQDRGFGTFSVTASVDDSDCDG